MTLLNSQQTVREWLSKRPVRPAGVPSRAGLPLAVSASLLLLIACGPSQTAAGGVQPTTPSAAGPDAVATAVAATVAAAGAPQASTAGFRDDFGDINLASGWSWIRENPTAWSLADRPGWLRIDTGATSMLGAGGDTPLLLYPAPTGAFEVRTQIEFSPAANFQFAGVLVYGDDDHFVSLGRAYCGLTPQCVGAGVYLDNDEAFLAGQTETNAVGGVPQGKAIWLRLVRDGSTFNGYWSSDGETWAKVGSTEASFAPKSTGLMATNGGSDVSSIPAYFDLFQVNAPPTTIVERGGVCAESMDDLAFVSDGYLANGSFLVTLGKSSGFQSEAYSLLVNNAPYECSILNGRTDRIYCTGRTVPPTGQVHIQLTAADSSCEFTAPFDSISVLPKAPPTGPGGYN